MNRTLKTLAAAVMLLPGLALADISNYNLLQASYQTGQVSGLDVHGWGIRGSAELHERVFIQLTHIDTGLNEVVPNLDLDADSTTVGLGFVFDQNSTASVYGQASYMTRRVVSRVTDPDLLRVSDRGDGFELELGARIRLVAEAELRVAVSHADLGKRGELTRPSAELVYKFMPNFAGVVNYAYKRNNDMLGLGLRYYFQ